MAQRNYRAPSAAAARWLTGLWDLSGPDGLEPYNLIRHDQGGGANLSGATPIADQWGDGWTLGNGSYLDYLQLASDASLYIGTSEFTLLVEFRQTAAGSQANCAIFGAGDSGTHLGQIYTASSNANLGYMIGWYAAPNFGSVANTNTVRQCAALTTGPRGTELWRNGVRIATAVAMSRVAGGAIRLGQTATGSTDYGRTGPTVFYTAACSKLQLPVDLLSALTATPELLFAPRARRATLTIISGGTSTIAATTDALVIAEQGATLRHTVGAGPDALLLGEQSSTPRHAVPTTTDALSIAEQAAVTLHVIQTSVDALTVSEQTTIVVHTVATTTENITVTEQAAASRHVIRTSADALVLDERPATFPGGPIACATKDLMLGEQRATLRHVVVSGLDALAIAEQSAICAHFVRVSTDTLAVNEHQAALPGATVAPPYAALDYTVARGRMHYLARPSRMHYTAGNRLHYAA